MSGAAGDLAHIAAFLNEQEGDARTRRLRAALREVLAGGRPALSMTVTLTLDEHARVVPAPGDPGGPVVAAVLAAQADGSWPRLKLCAADDCGRAFVDRSRNRSATWCSMATCGNRAKVSAFRARARSQRPGAGSR